MNSNHKKSTNPYPTYDAQWETVDLLESEGKPKSARLEVEKIYAKASQNENAPQIYKSLYYLSKYELQLEEDAALTIVKKYKNEIEKAQTPSKQLLESALANLYWSYYQTNQYRFRARSSSNTIEDDFRTWDLNKLLSESDYYYNQSLQPQKELLSYSSDDFDAILTSNDTDYAENMPTLYDVLAYEALEFYTNDQSSINKPADQFEIRDKQAFGSTKDFLKFNPKTTDQSSFKLKSLNIYKDLLSSKIKNKQSKALIFDDLNRLEFCYKNAVVGDKEQLYELSLKSVFKNHQNEDGAYAIYQLADLYNQQGEKYVATEESTSKFAWKKMDAYELCEQIITEYPKSLAAHNCNQLAENIKSKNIDIRFDENIIPNQPAKLLIKYKNVKRVTFQIRPCSFDLFVAGENYGSIAEEVQNLPVKYSWNVDLNDLGDFQEHATESIINNNNYTVGNTENLNLQPGLYFITTNSDNNDGLFVYKRIQVTSIAYAKQASLKGSNLFINNRKTGQGIEQANFEIFELKDGQKRSLNKGKTNKQGSSAISFDPPRSYDNYIRISIDGETAYFNYNYSYPYRKASNKYFDSANIFTDRSIYRPGQTLYFKAILLGNSNNNSKIITNKKVQVELYDPNSQVVASQKLTSNDFGSIHGSFIIPRNRLTGNYYLSIKEIDSYHRISVEEYKRPKFEVEINPLKGDYKVNQKINVSGKAVAFAGSVISDAKVVYRVTRSTSFPYPLYRGWSPYFPVSSQEIAYGETTTQEDGSFIIPFDALPDESIDLKTNPVFHYDIHVDVIDQNGETRSADGLVSVGSKAMMLSINDKNWQKNDSISVQIHSKNLNEQPLSSKIDVQIFKLNAPNRPLLERKWALPDQQNIDEETYNQLFPFDAYKKSELLEYWPNGERLFNEQLQTSEKGEGIIKLDSNDLPAGYYLIKASGQDAFGQYIEQEKIVFLKEEFQSTSPDKLTIETSLNQKDYTPGDELKIAFKSSLTQLPLRVQLFRDNEIIKEETININKIEYFTYPIENKDVGGLTVHYYGNFENRAINKSINISIPYQNQKIEFGVKTFRDHIKPGEAEKWEFTLKGEDGEKIAAEVISSMYDASLDQFQPHSWSFVKKRRQQLHYYNRNIESRTFNIISTNSYYSKFNNYYLYPAQAHLNTFGFNWYQYYSGAVYGVQLRSMAEPMMEDAAEMEVLAAPPAPRNKKVKSESLQQEKNPAVDNAIASSQLNTPVQIRKNFNETAFFYPDLKTDEEGNVHFSFTSPEALTKWKVQLFGHTKDLKYGQWEGYTQTQKELMVLPNPPRFLRMGDQIVFSTKISNLSDKNLHGTVELKCFDALTMQPIDKDLSLVKTEQKFDVNAGGNTNALWHLTIPDQYSAITYRVIAKSEQFSDGEQQTLPVLSNRMLVTETLPMIVRGNETRKYSLDKLINQESNTLTNQSLTIEMTSNPVWYAVQALPYLMEYPYECSEQNFSRFYANTLASHIANSNPKIKAVFDSWKAYEPEALLSNLEKNQEFKALMLKETPWVFEAQSEGEQKRRIALLFDLNNLANQQKQALDKLYDNQNTDGGWPWFKGGRSNRYITQHIVAGFGHLNNLKVYNSDETNTNLYLAIQYLDNELTKQFEDLKSRDSKWQELKHVDYTTAHYFYARSFFKDIQIKENNKDAFDFYFKKLNEDWISKSLYRNGLVALSLHRYGKTDLAKKIIEALDEQSISSDDLGMYWKENTASWYWYQAPIETQSLLIEAFDEVANDEKSVENLKIWLLNHKRTNSWETTKSTADAIYALLLRGDDWVSHDNTVTVQLGDHTIDSRQKELAVESGTGYFKKTYTTSEIKPNMGNISISKTGSGIAWGGLYWQYFEDLDKITSHESPLKLSKELMLKKQGKNGPVLHKIENQKLAIGDLITVKIIIKVDRDMEFVHLKDMRASGFEPTSVLSQYKWQDGLGYYQSTKDASTDFFFDYLPKGLYVFEYDLRVNNAGDFSNGISQIQSMYALEFSSHSEGLRVQIKSTK